MFDLWNLIQVLFGIAVFIFCIKFRILPFGMAATTITGLNFQSKAYADTLMAMLVDKVAFLSSGMLKLDQTYSNKTGQYLAIDQYDKLDGTLEQLTAATDLGINAIGDLEDQAVWLERGISWGNEDWTRWIAGKDPLTEIARQIADYYARKIQTAFMSVLQGIFTTALATTHSTGNTYNAATINSDAVIGAKKLLGDESKNLSLAIMHSKVWYDALKEEIAKYTPIGSTGAYQSGTIQQLLGMNAVMDDVLTSTADVYSTYFGLPGSAIYSIREQNTEPYRLPLKAGGTDILVTRISFFVHVPGVKWNVLTPNPSDVQLATDTNWLKAYTEDKNIKLVQLKTL